MSGGRRSSRGGSAKLRKAVRLAAADLLEPGLHDEVEERLGRTRLRLRLGRGRIAAELVKEGRALLDEPDLVVVREIDPDLEAAYLMRRDLIVLAPDMLGETVDAIREALLEEALHRCLWRAGLRDEHRHHEVIRPALETARRL